MILGKSIVSLELETNRGIWRRAQLLLGTQYMNKVILDESLRSKLQNLETELEFCDESGCTLGYFLPSVERDRLLYDRARAQITDEELERRRQEPGGRTTAEVLARLAKR
jgi:hypothetical protein